MTDIPEFDQWTAKPTPDNMAAVLRSLDSTINAEVQRYSGPKPILRGKARTLAVKAVKTYTPQQGAQLRSWVVTQLQPLARYSQQLRPIKIPEDVVRRGAELHRLSGELADQLGREPTLIELADETGLSTKRIQKIRDQMMPVVSESGLAIRDPAAGPDLPGTTESDAVGNAESMVLASLDARDRQIHAWKTGRGGVELSNQEIARRLGISPAAVSQRSQAIALKIRDMAVQSKRGN